MGEGNAVPKCPSDPRSGLTCIVRLWESTFALRAVNEQTFTNLRTTEHASENIKVARHLRRQRSSEFLAEEKRKIDNTIWQTHTAVHSISKILEPARVDRVDMYGDEKITLSTKGLWVLNESPDINAAFDQVQVAHEALDEVIGSLQSPRKKDRVPLTQPIAVNTPSSEMYARPVPYNASQLLAWRRQSRMNLRRDAARPPKTEGLGEGTPGVEFASMRLDSHNIEPTALKAAAQTHSDITLPSQQHDRLLHRHDPTSRNHFTSLPEVQPPIPPKSPSRVFLQTHYPSPPQSDTGSSPPGQYYDDTTLTQNQYHSPPESSHGNSPPSQHKISPKSQSFAPLQDQYQTSLQIEYQNALRGQHNPFLSTYNDDGSTKHFEAISDDQTRLPRGYVPRQNPNELPPERQYHIPQSFLERTRSKYRYNVAPRDYQYETSSQDWQDQYTAQVQQHQKSPEDQQQHQQNHQDQQKQRPLTSDPTPAQLQYHNPGPFFLGNRERAAHARNASEPAWPTYQPQELSERGYRLPMVFEESLYGGLEVVPPDYPEPVASVSPPQQSQPQDHEKRLEVLYPGLESVSAYLDSQHDPISMYQSTQNEKIATQAPSNHNLGNPHSQSQYDLVHSYSRIQEEAPGTYSQSHHNPRDPYSQPEQRPGIISSHSNLQDRPGITHTQSLNESGNPYARPNKRKSWLAWQASRSVTARGLNNRYSL